MTRVILIIKKLFLKLKTSCAKLKLRWSHLRRLIYFPQLLSKKEKYTVVIMGFILVISSAWLAQRILYAVTIPVPDIGGSLTEGSIGQARTINPLYATKDADRDIVRLVYSRLFTYTASGELKPDLAKSYEVSPDGKTYTIYLREDARWHDGKKVSADDVEFTIKMLLNPQYKSILRPNWQGVTVEKLDATTLRLTLRAPYAPFVENLMLDILPKHLWDGIGPEEAPLHPLNLRPIGSGPYRFDDLKQNADGSIAWIRLSRNRAYYREGPYLKTITFSFFNTETELLKAYRAGKIQSLGPLSKEALGARSKKSKVVELRTSRIFGIFFNEKKTPILQEKVVREAIARSINRDEIVTRALTGAVKTEMPFQWLVDGQDTDITAYPFDVETARALLEKSGWKDADGDGVREKLITKRVKNKTITETVPLTFVLTTSDWPDFSRTAEIIKSSLARIGVGITIEKKSFTELEQETIRSRNFEILLFGQVYSYLPDPFAFWHSSQIKDPGLNITSYANKQADALIEGARRTADESARREYFDKLAAIIIKDLPAVFLYSQQYLYLVPSDLKGAFPKVISLPSDRFTEVNTWHFDVDRVFK